VTNSGPPAYLTGKNDHTPVPVGGTYKRETDGKPASLTDGADYPVTAECKICHGRIRLGHLMQWEWQHAPAPVAVSGGDAAC
jgi:hypothetical protein